MKQFLIIILLCMPYMATAQQSRVQNLPKYDKQKYTLVFRWGSIPVILNGKKRKFIHVRFII
jgi:hypothetical protein